MSFFVIIKLKQLYPTLKTNLGQLQLLIKKHHPSSNYNITIAHSDNLDEANQLVELLKNKYPNVNNIPIYELGCALGVHTGPGALVIGIQKID